MNDDMADRNFSIGYGSRIDAKKESSDGIYPDGGTGSIWKIPHAAAFKTDVSSETGRGFETRISTMIESRTFIAIETDTKTETSYSDGKDETDLPEEQVPSTNLVVGSHKDRQVVPC